MIPRKKRIFKKNEKKDILPIDTTIESKILSLEWDIDKKFGNIDLKKEQLKKLKEELYARNQ